MNVILSGGGMKGAYQYGFFKRLYEVEPNFKINKVFAISVGSLNALPIITKKIELLDHHWINKDGLMPFDTIVNEWDSVKSREPMRRNIERAKAFLKNGSIYHSLNVEPCFNVLNSLNAEELKIVSKTLIIISFDTRTNTVVFHRCRNINQTVEAIKSSTMMPGLFQIEPERNIIDVVSLDFNSFCARDLTKKWLCLDLQGSTRNTDNLYAFSPKIAKSPSLNLSTCLIVNRCIIDDLIENGREDADIFLMEAS